MSIGLHLHCWVKNVGSKGSLHGEPVSPCNLLENFWFTIWSVGDADNFRLYHTPALGYNWPLKFRRIPIQKGSPNVHFFLLLKDSFSVIYRAKGWNIEYPHCWCWCARGILLVLPSAHQLFSQHFDVIFKAGHFGKPPQPYAAESLAWLREKILGKIVYCQLLRKDQYSRIVSPYFAILTS